MGSLSTATPSAMAAAADAFTSAGDDDHFDPLNADEVRSYLHKAVDFIYDYYKTVETLPVLPAVEPGYLAHKLKSSSSSSSSSSPSTAAAPPTAAAPFDVAMHELREAIVPGTTHWASPNFFAFFPATNSAAALAGDLVASAMNTVGFTWQANPAAAELEALALDWLAHLLLLPSTFLNSSNGGTTGGGGGVILGSTSEAMLVTLVAARDAALRRSSSGGMAGITKLTVYASDQTHSTFFKACRLAGFDPANFRCVPTAADTDYALDPAKLLESMRRDVDAGLVPTYVCATVGTTSCNAVDPVGAIADVASAFDGAWVHVDAAYAGSACICPEFRRHLDGVERVDSLSVSPHKWLLTCLDCTCLWVRNTWRLTSSLETSPEYLKKNDVVGESAAGGGVTTTVDLKDMQVGVGRRFRGLKLWMVMRTYGAAKLRDHIRSDVAMAKMFEDRVRADDDNGGGGEGGRGGGGGGGGRFEVVVPRKFALVCFRIRPGATARGTEEDADVANRELVERVNRSGRAFVAGTVIGGKFVLRFAVGSSLQEERHVRGAWELIQRTADRIIKGQVADY